MPGFVVQNFGCRASQADGSAIESSLRHAGWGAASGALTADLVVLNTCTVTAAADDELRRVVRRIHGANPQGRIVVTGCYAQRAPEELRALPGVSLVVGNSHKPQLASLLSTPYHGEVRVAAFPRDTPFDASPVEDALTGRARPNLKIQDGCGNRCSFCVIPSVRGGSRSAPLDNVMASVLALSRSYPEVVLTGINLGRWGRELAGRLRLADLLRALLAGTSIQRLRLSSVEPMDWSTDLLELMAATPRIAQHVHAPLQSGSDSVLRRMFRKYRPRHYADRIHMARRLMPNAAIGADVMTGFPGETDAEFDETKRFIEELPLTYLHVFPYSERPGTAAIEHSNSINAAVRKERARILIELGADKNRAFRRSQMGRTLSAVTLLDGTAMTTNYINVKLARSVAPLQLIDVAPTALTEAGMREQSLFPMLDR